MERNSGCDATQPRAKRRDPGPPVLPEEGRGKCAASAESATVRGGPSSEAWPRSLAELAAFCAHGKRAARFQCSVAQLPASKMASQPQPLAGEVVCLSGFGLSKDKAALLQTHIERRGGELTWSLDVHRNTVLVLGGEPSGPKWEAAKAAGMPVVKRQWLREVLTGTGATKVKPKCLKHQMP